MALPFVDTDVLIRLLTGDDPAKQAQAADLFEQVERGELQLAAPNTVIADAVYVLSLLGFTIFPVHTTPSLTKSPASGANSRSSRPDLSSSSC